MSAGIQGGEKWRNEKSYTNCTEKMYKSTRERKNQTKIGQNQKVATNGKNYRKLRKLTMEHTDNSLVSSKNHVSRNQERKRKELKQ